MKYFLMGIGVLSIVLFLSLLVIGVKVVSTVFLYIVGAIAIMSLIGFVIYFVGKTVGKNSNG